MTTLRILLLTFISFNIFAMDLDPQLKTIQKQIESGENIKDILNTPEGQEVFKHLLENDQPSLSELGLLNKFLINCEVLPSGINLDLATNFYLEENINKFRLVLKYINKKNIGDNKDSFAGVILRLLTDFNKHISAEESKEYENLFIKILIWGANPNAKLYLKSDRYLGGMPFLFQAIPCMNVKLIKILLIYGASIVEKNEFYTGCSSDDLEYPYDNLKRYKNIYLQEQFKILEKLLKIDPSDLEIYERDKKEYQRVHPDEFNPVKKYPGDFKEEFECLDKIKLKELIEKNGTDSVGKFLYNREIGLIKQHMCIKREEAYFRRKQ